MSIFVFADHGGTINTQALLYLKHYLHNILSSRGAASGFVTEDDFKSSILKSSLSSQLPQEAILPHLNLVIESCLHPVLNESFCIRLQPREWLIGKDTDYLIALLGYLKSNTPPQSQTNTFDEFRRDAYRSMALLAESQPREQQKPSASSYDIQSQHSEVDKSGPTFRAATMESSNKLSAFARPHVMASSLQPTSQAYYSQVQVKACSYPFSQEAEQEKSQTFDNYSDMRRPPPIYHDAPPGFMSQDYKGRSDVKSVRPIYPRLYIDLTTFSSHMRKNGMDIILFPSIHDKVLCCIYLASSIPIPGEGHLGHYPPRTHKDLVDVVMHVQSAKYLGHDDKTMLSKTKLRGVLGLLKNAGLLIVQHENLEEPGGKMQVSPMSGSSLSSKLTPTQNAPIKEVKLIMNAAIRNFEDFRDMHDAYLPECMKLLNSSLNPADLSKIVWSSEEKQTKLTRASCYIGLIRGVVKSKLIQSVSPSLEPVQPTPNFIRTRTVSQDEWEDLSKQIEGMSQIPSPYKDVVKQRQHTPQTLQMFYPGATGPPAISYDSRAPPSHGQYALHRAEETKNSTDDFSIFASSGARDDGVGDSTWFDSLNQNDDDIERLTRDLMKKDA